MRLWSLHPDYLDAKGLLAVWREALLAKHVLEGKTRGYIHHPQLIRFRDSGYPLRAINVYLQGIYETAISRGYNFAEEKIDQSLLNILTLPVTEGQIHYEREHLLKKLMVRDQQKYSNLLNDPKVKSHPLFRIISGGIENWEKIEF